MNDQMQSPEELEEMLAAEQLDGWDATVLDAMAAMYDEADPVPDGLTDRLEFALALDEVYAEVAQITRMSLDAALVRSDSTQTRADTLTFSAESLTAMVTLTRADDGRVRIDGWLTPADSLEVRLRTTEGTLVVQAESTGRFVFDGVPSGMAQLSFHPAGPDAASVVTPAFEV